MPRLPIDYSKTIIYKLCCLDQSITDIYIGHTTDFTKRKGSHKSDCCDVKGKEYKFKVYQFIREHGGWDNWQMIQIEAYPCKNNREASAREDFWMKELNSTLNSIQSFTTEEEKKEYMKEYHKKWYKKNALYLKEKYFETTEQRKEYKKEWYKKNALYLKELYKKNALYLNELKFYNI
jgi:hypothetical protein